MQIKGPSSIFEFQAKTMKNFHKFNVEWEIGLLW